MDRRPPYEPPAEPPPPPSEAFREHVPPPGFVDYWDWGHLGDNAGGVHTGRLAEELRRAAQNFEPMSKLTASAIERLNSSPLAKSDALADLAVTGRESFHRFMRLHPTDETVLAAVMAAMPRVRRSNARVAVRATLDRAYGVAWALRGDPAHRQALRDGLGWIAVSSEDDPAHAPTNISATNDHMGEISLSVAPGFHRCRASIKVAVPPPSGPLPDVSLRQLPILGAVFQDLIMVGRRAHYDRLILFIHGLGSRLEESEHFKQLVIDKGLERGQRFAVLSIDLPGFGYSSRLDVDSLIRERVRSGGFHGFRLPDGRNSNFPLLGFYRDVILDLSNRVVGGIQHVMGGSLGGNLTLWAAEKPNFSALRPPANQLRGLHSFASWSPASIWESYERSRDTPFEGNGTHMDIGKNGAKTRSLQRMSRPETESVRRTDFFELMQRGETLLGAHTLGAWGYPPTQGGMLTQTEFYSAAYRRVFWMASYEQVTFSHQEPLTHARGLEYQWPFKTIDGPLLLASGANDTGSLGVMDIYNNVVRVTDHANTRDVPGRRLLMQNTGHSISDERPTHLAAEVIDFFLGPWGGWRPMDGVLRNNSSLVVAFDPDPRRERVDVCGIGPTGIPHHNYRDAVNGLWRGWTNMGGAIAISSGLALVRNADARLALFGIGPTGIPYYNYQTARNGGWSGWTDMGGVLAVGSGLAVGHNADGRLELFGIGPTGIPHHNYQTTPDGSWSGWSTMGNLLSITSGLAVGRNADGRLELFGITPAGAPQHRSQVAPNSGWGEWASLGGWLTPSSTMVVESNADGRLEVFGVGPADIGHTWQTAPNGVGGWQTWRTMAFPGAVAAGSGIGVARNLDGRLEVFVIGPDGVVKHKAQLAPNSDWGEWQQFEGVPPSGISTTSGLAVGKNADGRLELFGIGSDGAPWHKRNSH